MNFVSISFLSFLYIYFFCRYISFVIFFFFCAIVREQNKFQGEESAIYVHHVTILQKSYTELTMTSKKRLADLEMLQDFIQSATTELIWLNEKEEIEISRDWSSKSLNVTEIERYYEVRARRLKNTTTNPKTHKLRSP